MEQIKMESKLLLSIFDHLCHGLIHVGGNGTYVANLAARRLIEEEDGIVSQNGHVVPRHSRDARNFRSAIDRAKGVDGSRPQETLMTIARREGVPPLNVLVAPSFGRLPDGQRVSAGAVIFLADPLRPYAPNLGERLRAIFSLTPSEARIVEAVVDGKRLDEVALMMGNSVETVRAHLRHVFDKTGVHRQSDLVRIVMSSTAILDPLSNERTG